MLPAYKPPERIIDNIRLARPEDAERIFELSGLIFEEDRPVESKTFYESVARDQQRHIIWVYCDDKGKAQGYIYASRLKKDDEARIHQIAVDEDFQKQGIGTALMALCLRHMEKVRVKHVYLLAINSDIASLAKHFGFICDSPEPEGRGEYHLDFSKSVPPSPRPAPVVREASPIARNEPGLSTTANTLGKATIAFRLMSAFEALRGSYNTREDFNVTVTFKCPFDCGHCCAAGAKKAGGFNDVPLDKLKGIFDELRGFNRVHIVGTGEPLAYGKKDYHEGGVSPEFVEMIKYAAERVKEVRIVTNAYLVPEDMAAAKKFFSQFPKNVVWLVSVDQWHQEEMLKKSGKTLSKIIRKLKRFVRAGISTSEIDKFAQRLIMDEKVTSAFKGYNGFPANICTSVNEEVVHGIPGERILKEGDIVSLDVGIILDGFVGDTATTVAVGMVDWKVQRLLDVTEKALYAGIAMANILHCDFSSSCNLCDERRGIIRYGGIDISEIHRISIEEFKQYGIFGVLKKIHGRIG